ncbi:hypothetical protein FLONG3_4608 [Fusarium longipes]|uniref:Uncharacterized protein n=1 Tax=Fusarium longipes TaxID=694270 RepID=A0A395SX90_9HYPO|nr:hypothetical protein FLONG3_4608 [Fusarium longipes]
MVSFKLVATVATAFSIGIAEAYSKNYDCSDTCAKEIKLIEGHREDCYDFISRNNYEVVRHLNKLPKKYKYICKGTVDFVNACYCLDDKKKYDCDDCDPVTTTTDFVLVPQPTTTTTTDSETTTTTESTTTTTTESTTTTTTTTTTESSCPTSPATCDNPFSCGGDVPYCSEGSQCFCASTTEGDNVCILDFICSSTQTCSSSSECTIEGQRCITNTCCPDSCASPATNEQCQASTQQQGLRVPAGRRARGSSATF